MKKGIKKNINEDVPNKNLSLKSSTVINSNLGSENLLAFEKAKIHKKLAEKERKAADKKMQDFETLIDKDIYSSTLQDFKEDAAIKQMNFGKAQYLQHLRNQKVRYSKILHLYSMYDGNYEETKKIVEFISIEIESSIKNETGFEKVALSKIFNEKNNGFDVCKELLEELDLTIGGIPDIKKGRVGKLTGLISALKATNGMFNLDKPTDMQLLKIFNSYLNAPYKTFSKRNEAYKESLNVALRYIKNNFKKVTIVT